MKLVRVMNTTEWIRTRLITLEARPDTAAYVVGVLASKDLARLVDHGSIVMAHAAAGARFDLHQRLADGVLAAEIAFPGWLEEPTLCVELARRSYAVCYRQLNETWECYAELAERLPEIVIAGREAWLAD